MTDNGEPGKEDAVEPPTAEAPVFVISPIGPVGSAERRRADGLYDGVLTPVLNDLGVESIRADRIEKLGIITTQVVRHIVEAPLVIADLTSSNPNVYYELGLADAFRVPVIRFIDDAKHLPFDARPDRTIELDDDNGAIEVLSAARAKETFRGFATSALAEKNADSVVSLAELRASWDLQPTSGRPEGQMLRTILREVDDLRRSAAAPGLGNMDEVDVLRRLATSVAGRYNDVEILPGTDGYIVDMGEPISEADAEMITDRFSAVFGYGRDIRILHGTYPDPSPEERAESLYGDEEPF